MATFLSFLKEFLGEIPLDLERSGILIFFSFHQKFKLLKAMYAYKSGSSHFRSNSGHMWCGMCYSLLFCTFILVEGLNMLRVPLNNVQYEYIR